MRRANRVLTAQPSRRDFLFNAGMGLGTVALSAMVQRQKAQAGVLSPKQGHHPAKAKNCIFLLMTGGPSHIDTFDPKPKLGDLHMTEFAKERTKFEASMNTGKRYFVRSPFQFRRAGKLGIEINAGFERFSECVDDVCFYRGLQAISVNHPTALFHINTGNRFGGDPAMGSWITYGLGTENENLPGFVVLPDLAYPQGGAANWSNGFLPAYYQGTPLRAQGAPVLDMNPPEYVSEEQQRANLELLEETVPEVPIEAEAVHHLGGAPWSEPRGVLQHPLVRIVAELRETGIGLDVPTRNGAIGRHRPPPSRGGQGVKRKRPRRHFERFHCCLTAQKRGFYLGYLDPVEQALDKRP